MDKSNEFIFLDKTTDFTGEIRTSNVILEGKISGKVHAEHAIRLKPGSEMQADVYTENFYAEKDSLYDGKLKILKTNHSEKGDTEPENDNQQKDKRVEQSAGSTSVLNKAAAVLSSMGLL